VAVVGLEQLQFPSGNTANQVNDDAQNDARSVSAAVLAGSDTNSDDALRRLLTVWPSLSSLAREKLADLAQAYSTAETGTE
jgi:hypothetical protein